MRPERFRQTPERDARLARIDTVTPETEAQSARRDLEKLFDQDDNREVRAWTARRFREVDPDFSSAALSGLVEGASTREAQRPTVPARAKAAAKAPDARQNVARRTRRPFLRRLPPKILGAALRPRRQPRRHRAPQPDHPRTPNNLHRVRPARGSRTTSALPELVQHRRARIGCRRFTLGCGSRTGGKDARRDREQARERS